MNRVLAALSRNLFGFERPDAPGERLFARAVEALVVLSCVDHVWKWAFYIERLTDVVLPLGIANYVDVRFMYGNALPYALAAVVTALAAAGFARVARWPYLAAFALLHLQYAARDVFGEISHSSNLVAMGLLGFALAAFAFGDERARRRFALGFLLFFVGFAYSIAAVCKLAGTGITWPDGLHLWMWVTEKGIDTQAQFGAADPNFFQRLLLSSRPLATVFLVGGLLTEAAGFLVWFRRTRTPALLAIAGLHAGIKVVMGILFLHSTLLVLLLALGPYAAAWAERAWARRPRAVSGAPA